MFSQFDMLVPEDAMVCKAKTDDTTQDTMVRNKFVLNHQGKVIVC